MLMEYKPVCKVALKGQQTGEALAAFEKRIPTDANLSRLGVNAKEFPAHPITSARCWSGWMINTLVFFTSEFTPQEERTTTLKIQKM